MGKIGERLFYVRIERNVTKISGKFFLRSILRSNGYQFALHIEHIRNRRIQSLCDFECEENGGVRVPVLNAHNRLSAYSYPDRKLLLSHPLFKTKNANAIADGHLGHGNL